MCTEFRGHIVASSYTAAMKLSVLTDGLDGGAAAHTIVFSGNTTANPTPASGPLSAGPRTIGDFTAGQEIYYSITKTGGGDISGSVVMRAAELTGVHHDWTFDCPTSWRRGKRTWSTSVASWT